MTETAHTPGPWHYQEGSDAYTHIVRTGEISRDNPHVGRRFLCQLAQTTSGESEANARLIAAAPDLLAAATKVLAGLNSRLDYAAAHDQASPIFVGIGDLHSAIAKAEGRPMPSPNHAK